MPTDLLDLLLVSTLVAANLGLLAAVLRSLTLLRRANDRADRAERLLQLGRPPMATHRRVGVGR